MTMIDLSKLIDEGDLKGRGHSGLSKFYRFFNGVFLVKQDDPGTCFAEAMAILYDPLPLEHSVSPIIQAEVLFAKTRSEEIIMVSKQPRFECGRPYIKPCGLDEIVLDGHKRKPMTFFSEESSHPESIKTAIGMMTPEAKKQFALAIYTSQLNGDESLHTGQFMVEKSDDFRKIVKIQRVDFGALGRYAAARTEFDLFHTSTCYASSGQFGKDYINFLLADREVNDHLLKLWVNTEVEAVLDAANVRLTQQLRNISEDVPIRFRDKAQFYAKEAICGFYHQLTRDVSCPVNIEKKSIGEARVLLESKYISQLERRCNAMKTAAIHESNCSAKIRIIENILNSERLDLGLLCAPLVVGIHQIIKNERLRPSERIALVENKINQEGRDMLVRTPFVNELIRLMSAIQLEANLAIDLAKFGTGTKATVPSFLENFRSLVMGKPAVKDPVSPASTALADDGEFSDNPASPMVRGYRTSTVSSADDPTESTPRVIKSA